MDLSKFLSMITYSAIPFTRVDSFDDPYDGLSWGTWNEVKKIKREINKYSTQKCSKIINEYVSLSKKYIHLLGEKMKSTFASCWALKENESVALWDLYVPYGKEGVAIQTSVNKLAMQFRGKGKKYEIIDPDNNYRMIDISEDYRYGFIMRKVEYNNNKESAYSLNNGDNFNECFIKRPFFDYENEFRIVIAGLNMKNFNIENKTKTIYAKVNLLELIDKIYISPRIDNWKRQLIINMIKIYNEKLNFLHSEKQIVQSLIFDKK